MTAALSSSTGFKNPHLKMSLIHGGSQVTIPIRMLHVVGAAAKENGRYLMTGVMLLTEVDGTKGNQIVAVATDGRRMVIARHDSGLFDGFVQAIIPGDVARAAMRLAATDADDEEPMGTLYVDGGDYTLKVATPSGDGVLQWMRDDAAPEFPPYANVIPDWSTSIGVASIGVNPELMASTLKVTQKVVGAEHHTRVYLPSSPDRAMGFEATDGKTMTVLAVVMPVKLSEWTDKPAEPAKESPADPAQPNLTYPTSDKWRTVPIEHLKVKPKVAEALVKAGLDTIGKIADFTAKPNARLTDIKGIGEASSAELEKALDAYWAANPPPAEPAEPAKAAEPAPAAVATPDASEEPESDAEVNHDAPAADAQPVAAPAAETSAVDAPAEPTPSRVSPPYEVGQPVGDINAAVPPTPSVVREFSTWTANTSTLPAALRYQIGVRPDGTFCYSFTVNPGYPEVGETRTHAAQGWCEILPTVEEAQKRALIELRYALKNIRHRATSVSVKKRCDELSAQLDKAYPAAE